MNFTWHNHHYEKDQHKLILDFFLGFWVKRGESCMLEAEFPMILM